MEGKFKSGQRVVAKAPVVTKVQIAARYAARLSTNLEFHAKSLQTLDTQSEIPAELYTPIRDFFAAVIESSDQYRPSLKQLTKKHLKKTQDLRSAIERLEKLTIKSMDQKREMESKLYTVLQELVSDVHHFIRMQSMTHESYTPGTSPNVGPVNWSLRQVIYDHITEYQSEFGSRKYPNLNAAQIRAKKSGHKLPERTYREIKLMHKNGTLFDYIQPIKRQ